VKSRFIIFLNIERCAGFRIPAESKGFFNSPKRLPLTEWVQDSFPGVKRPGRDTDYLPPTIGEVNND
jgi:hypothetical protein